MITAKVFKRKTGRKPIDDDLERCNCKEAGKEGHMACGWCKKCKGPQFLCICAWEERRRLRKERA